MERHLGSALVDWRTFPKKVAVQWNDTHSMLAIPKLMLLLMVDIEGLGWNVKLGPSQVGKVFIRHELIKYEANYLM